MLNILGIETSTEACSVALINSSGTIFSEFAMTPRQHTRYLPTMMNAVLDRTGLQRNDLSHIAYANGPGAFTGVRIATATAQGLAVGLGISLIPISTLAVLAQQACDQFLCTRVLAALDARMGEAYTALYSQNPATGLVELTGEEQLVKLELLQPQADVPSVGPGFKARSEAGFSNVEKSMIHEDILPSASALVKLAILAAGQGHFVSADKAEINYIRNKVAEKKKSRL